MLIKTHKFFNQLTQQALLDSVEGYVDKSKSLSNELIRLSSKFKIKEFYRFDLGENVDGFSPLIRNYLENPFQEKRIFNQLNEYPNITHRHLRTEIARHHKVNREQIVISTGLDSILDLITRVFFEYNDFYLMPIPDFYLFENYSERMGAKPFFLPLCESNNYAWTSETTEEFKDSIIRFKPKIAWISNPSNPSGQIISKEVIHELIQISHLNNVFLVIDEAYGEYIPGEEHSAIQYVDHYKNLMVLRTMSKAYGLAGIRLGYLICSSPDIVKALLLHRHHFPATQLAQKITSLAFKDQGFIKNTVAKNNKRKAILFRNLDKLKTFQYIPSHTNIFMLKNNLLDDEKLHLLLKQKGIITSMLRITGIAKKNYLRLTIRQEEDNNYLYQKCLEIEEEIFRSVKVEMNKSNISNKVS